MNINESVLGKYCIVRCDHASVFAGIVTERDGQAVLIKDARRIWYWNGAASLSQLAVDGTKTPGDCKFSVVCESVVVLDAIEIIPCTDVARQSIEGVMVWRH